METEPTESVGNVTKQFQCCRIDETVIKPARFKIPKSYQYWTRSGNFYIIGKHYPGLLPTTLPKLCTIYLQVYDTEEKSISTIRFDEVANIFQGDHQYIQIIHEESNSFTPDISGVAYIEWDIRKVIFIPCRPGCSHDSTKPVRCQRSNSWSEFPICDERCSCSSILSKIGN